MYWNVICSRVNNRLSIGKAAKHGIYLFLFIFIFINSYLLNLSQLYTLYFVESVLISCLMYLSK